MEKTVNGVVNKVGDETQEPAELESTLRPGDCPILSRGHGLDLTHGAFLIPCGYH